MVVKALYHQVQEVGKKIKKSKKRFTWKFNIDGKDHTLELFASFLSGKKKLVHNGKTILQEKKLLNINFNYAFPVEHNLLSIVQHGENFELRINNQAFSHLQMQEKTKKEFQYEDDFGKKTDSHDKEHSSWDDAPPKKTEEARKSSKPVKPKEPADDFSTGFSHGFDKFDVPANSNNASNNASNNESKGGFGDFGNFGKPQQDDPFKSQSNNYSTGKPQGAEKEAKSSNNFGDFGGFGQGTQNKPNDFGDFGQTKQAEFGNNAPKNNEWGNFNFDKPQSAVQQSAFTQPQTTQAPSNQSAFNQNTFAQSTFTQPQQQAFGVLPAPTQNKSAMDLLSMDEVIPSTTANQQHSQSGDLFDMAERHDQFQQQQYGGVQQSQQQQSPQLNQQQQQQPVDLLAAYQNQNTGFGAGQLGHQTQPQPQHNLQQNSPTNPWDNSGLGGQQSSPGIQNNVYQQQNTGASTTQQPLGYAQNQGSFNNMSYSGGHSTAATSNPYMSNQTAPQTNVGSPGLNLMGSPGVSNQHYDMQTGSAQTNLMGSPQLQYNNNQQNNMQGGQTNLMGSPLVQSNVQGGQMYHNAQQSQFGANNANQQNMHQFNNMNQPPATQQTSSTPFDDLL